MKPKAASTGNKGKTTTATRNAIRTTTGRVGPATRTTTGRVNRGNEDWRNRRDTTFTQLRSGDWGLRGYDLEDGATVDVLRKDGTLTTAVVGAVIWRDKEGTGLCLASVSKNKPQEPGEDRGPEDRRYQ